MSLLVDIQLFPIIYYFKILGNCSNITFEICDSFQKTSFRNRYLLATANGPVTLTIPVVGGRSQKIPYSEVLIDYSQNWPLQHWRTIKTSYSNSPFFEHYNKTLFNLIFSKKKKLVDFNMQALDWLFKVLKMEVNPQYSSSYQKSLNGVDDWRDRIKPNNLKTTEKVEAIRYVQVFEERVGFIPNLSILDLLFCEGPNAAAIVKQV